MINTFLKEILNILEDDKCLYQDLALKLLKKIFLNVSDLINLKEENLNRILNLYQKKIKVKN